MAHRLGGRLVALAASTAALFGCAQTAPPPSVALIQPDCYTVDLYQPVRIAPPANGAPASAKDFLGAWGGGAWDGSVCHDLWVMEIDAAGGTIMLDAHGPGYFPDATAFTRRGELGKDGRLRVRKGSAMVEYWIENGRLHGERRTRERTSRIILTRQS